VDVKHGEGRLGGQQGRAKELDFGLPTDETRLSRGGQPVSEPRRAFLGASLAAGGPSRDEQVSSVGLSQGQRAGQPSDGARMRRATRPALGVSDPPPAQARAFRQFLLRQASLESVPLHAREGPNAY
jgi:hypothetical protein